MSQLAKTIYFPDYPKGTSGRSGLTMPFPEGLQAAYASVAHLSSYAIREIIGYDSFARLEADALRKQTSTATYARDLLMKQVPIANGHDVGDHRLSLQATFQGGRGSPLHDWYPYLEGYSPEFVNSIIDNFAPQAATILDPFCGSGTTALIAALRGKRGFFSEVNPVCRFIIEAKLQAVRMETAVRERYATELEKFAANIKTRVRKFRPDVGLRASFSAIFGASDFFDGDTFEDVLRLRTFTDGLLASDPSLGRLVLVAILRSLVPGSLLIRRGDLRFRTAEELRRTQPDLLNELGTSLRRIASDLHDAPLATGTAELVCSDARSLSAHLHEPVDAIITSPPYLNGTNYFRNTKIELWFARDLSTKAGLRVLRDAAITAGINDVTMRKASGSNGVEISPTLRDVLDSFAGNSYDPRIPLMVRAYFGEMSRVIENFEAAVRPGGVAAIDLGDSCYGSVWVPTDRILADMMERKGFEKIDRVVLRERQSRDGRKLGQTLQVFRRTDAQHPKHHGRSAFAAKTLDSWEAFKQNLPHQGPEMSRRNWGHSLHSLCSYQGKLKPAIARSLVSALLPKAGGRILDPFAGVGTIPFEAQLAGHTGFGFDISPAALPITRAKIEEIQAGKVEKLLTRLWTWLLSANHKKVDLGPLARIRFNGPLPDYFHPRTLAEIVAARRFFQEHPPMDGSSALVFSAMLHILHGNRPYALSRRSHPITPFAPTGPAEYRPLMPRLMEKVEKSLASIANDPRRGGRAFFHDATKAWPDEVGNLDAIITSPPFYDSTRFHTANWMRLWFAGWEAEQFQTEPASFLDERQKKGFDVYSSIFRQSAERLKPGGLLLIHLGKSPKCDMAEALEKVAAAFLERLDLFSESVVHCESHGIRDKGTVTHHQYLLLRRE